MKNRLKHLPLPLLALVAACDSPSVPTAPQAPAAPLPAELCQKVREGLDALKNRGALVYADTGEATIDQQVWLEMGGGAREDLAKAIGFHAACAQGSSGGEQNVVIRDEGGLALMQRVVETKPDIRELLGKDEP